MSPKLIVKLWCVHTQQTHIHKSKCVVTMVLFQSHKLLLGPKTKTWAWSIKWGKDFFDSSPNCISHAAVFTDNACDFCKRNACLSARIGLEAHMYTVSLVRTDPDEGLWPSVQSTTTGICSHPTKYDSFRPRIASAQPGDSFSNGEGCHPPAGKGDELRRVVQIFSCYPKNPKLTQNLSLWPTL